MKETRKNRRFEISLIASLVLLTATMAGVLVNAALHAHVVV